jgi:hypothetical protein
VVGGLDQFKDLAVHSRVLDHREVGAYDICLGTQGLRLEALDRRLNLAL